MTSTDTGDSKKDPLPQMDTRRFRETWTAAQAARAGFEYARGTPSPEIAEILGGGIVDATVRTMVSKRWELPFTQPGTIGIQLPPKTLAAQYRAADALGITSAVFAARIVRCVADDRMINAILEDAK